MRRRTPSPPTHPPARDQQHHAGDSRDNAMLGVQARHAGLMSGQEARQLVGRHHEVDGGDDEQDNAEQRKDEFHGKIPLARTGSGRR